MNVLWAMVDWVREDATNLRESHRNQKTGEIENPAVWLEITEKEACAHLAEVSLLALGIPRE